MKKNIIFLIFILILSCQAWGINFDYNAEYLAGLCRIWGSIKYFHPYMAYKDIDLDLALVKSIPKVKSAENKEDYLDALDYFLSFLEDPMTATVRDNAPLPKQNEETNPPEIKQPEVITYNPAITIIKATDYSQFSAPEAQERWTNILKQITEETKTLIFDLRRQDVPLQEDNDTASFYFNRNFTQFFPQVLSTNIQMPTRRYRMHSGYSNQTNLGYSGYYSGFFYMNSGLFQGLSKTKHIKQYIFILNEHSQGFENLITGLQLEGLAKVIYEGNHTKSGGSASLLELPGGVQVTMRTSETVNPDGSIGFHPDLTIQQSHSGAALQTAIKIAQGEINIQSPAKRPPQMVTPVRQENDYPEMAYPAEEYRLLSLFRFWNVIHYFFPYLELMDQPWDQVLPLFIPKVIAASNELDYHLAIAELVHRIQDTHGFMRSPVYSKYIGTHSPPIEVKFVQNKAVVTSIFDESLKEKNIEVGDIILKIGDETVEEAEKRLSRYIAASTPQAMKWRIQGALLCGKENSPIHLSIKKEGGKILEVKLIRAQRPQRSSRKLPVFTVLPSGYGYIDLARLNIAEVDDAFHAIRDTSAVIFDMRGYPRGTAWYIAPRFAEKKTPVALFQRPEHHATMPQERSIKTFTQYTYPSDKPHYKGKVVMLINEEAISQAEHTCLFMESVTDVTFIGSPTNGANGDVTRTILPGNISVSFTGHNVRHADGRQLQRAGIQPDIVIQPTIAGIREGRDEVLERAIQYLKDSK